MARRWSLFCRSRFAESCSTDLRRSRFNLTISTLRWFWFVGGVDVDHDGNGPRALLAPWRDFNFLVVLISKVVCWYLVFLLPAPPNRNILKRRSTPHRRHQCPTYRTMPTQGKSRSTNFPSQSSLFRSMIDLTQNAPWTWLTKPQYSTSAQRNAPPQGRTTTLCSMGLGR